MRVLVVGGNGFVGSAVTGALMAKGAEVVSVSRSGPRRMRQGVTYEIADRNKPHTIGDIARRHRTRVVVDMIALTTTPTSSLLDELDGVIERYVLVSSCDVYRNYDGLRRHDHPAPILKPLDEASPLRTRLYPYRGNVPRSANDPSAWMDDYDKIPLERIVAGQTKFAWTILRLPMVFGPGDAQRRFSWAIAPMKRGNDVIDVDAQWAQWRTTYGYVDDVGAAIALAATDSRAADRVYNVGTAEVGSNIDWANRIAQELAWKGELRLVERSAVAPALAQILDGLDLSYPLIADTGRIRRELGFSEPTDEGEALRRTIDDEQLRGTA